MKRILFIQRSFSVVVLCFFIFNSVFSLAQNPLVKIWDKRYGGTSDETLEAIQQTNDGGFILGGQSFYGIGGDKTQLGWGIEDYWIVKTDSLGNKQWDKAFGGTDHDLFYALQQTKDHGYIVGGLSWSHVSGNKTDSSRGQCDYWFVKTDSLGNKEWDKVFGGTDGEGLSSIQQTFDGGYILGGGSFSGIGGDKTQPNWNVGQTPDYWVVKTDSLGNKQWDKDFGGIYSEQLNVVQQTADGGYILGGHSNSGISGDKTQPLWGTVGNDYDYWIVKTDSLGNKQWDKDFGGTGIDALYSIQQTSDKGFILAGWSKSGISGDKTQPLWGTIGVDYDYWIVKIDSLGNKQWDRDFGGTNWDQLNSIQNTSDDGFILSGWSYSGISGDKTENNLGQKQTWVVKIDSAGIIQWDKTIQTLGANSQGLALQARDRCYVMANYDSSGIGGYKSQTSQGGYDYWIVKFCDSTLTTTNIEKSEREDAQLLIWPNPVNAEFKIKNAKLKIDRIEVFTILGDQVYVPTDCHPDSYQEQTVDCRLLPPGIYFVKATAGDKVYFGKIRKE